MEEARSRRLLRRGRIPDNELQWFVCSSAAFLRERGGYSDGFTSHGIPDTCPYSDFELGTFARHGEGQIERARECGQAWHRIGAEHQAALAAYYVTGEVGSDRIDGSSGVEDALYKARVEAVMRSMQVPVAIVKAGLPLELVGVGMLLLSLGIENDLARRAREAVRVAHEIWWLERDRVKEARASRVRWVTGVVG